MSNQTTSKSIPSKSTKLRGKRQTTNEAPQKLKLLITIVGRNKAEFYMDLLQSMNVNFQLAMLGQGTANREMLNLLGLSDSDKTVIFSTVREDRAKQTLSLLDEKFRTVRGGKGIAYTIPMSSVVGVAIYQFLSDNRMSRKEGQ
jgi:hypothetical protein